MNTRELFKHLRLSHQLMVGKKVEITEELIEHLRDTHEEVHMRIKCDHTHDD